MKILDADHPFFAPRWRRVAVVAFCALWSFIEFATGAPMWGMITGALAAYTAWVLLYSPEAPRDPDSDAADPDLPGDSGDTGDTGDAKG